MQKLYDILNYSLLDDINWQTTTGWDENGTSVTKDQNKVWWRNNWMMRS